MRQRRVFGLSAVWLLLCGPALALAWWLLCPRPALYGETPFSTAVLDADGGLLRLTLAADDRYRLFTPLDRIAPAAVEATLAYEDAWFYQHTGINPVALLRAGWQTYVAGGRRVGASTITMQLARLRFGIDSSTLGGKLSQMLRALQLERHYAKNELLEAYLNLAPYGGNVEGLGTAARVYYDSEPAELTTLQALTLATVPQNPNVRRPGGAEPAALAAARQRALEIWLERHPEDADLRGRAALPLPARAIAELPYLAPHYVDRLLADLPPRRRGSPHPGDVTGTLAAPLQRLAERTLATYLGDRHGSGIDNAAVLIVDARDGAVRALVGSADWYDAGIQGQVNGTAARRSPGSVLKPFVYALALDQGLIHPMTLMADAPVRYGAYTPENFDRGFLGPVFARDALVYSRNVPAVNLAARLDAPDFHALLKQAGIGELRDRSFYGLAIVLGGVEVTMEEVVGLYGALHGGGVQRPLAFKADAAAVRPGRRLFSAEAAFVTLSMLEDNPPPGAAPPLRGSETLPMPWKTGTSYGYRDAWAVGLVGPYVVAVWAGNFAGQGNPALVGREAAAPLLFRLADGLRDYGLPADSGRVQAGGLNLRRVAVCASTGDLPGRHCPASSEAWFIPGVSPIAVSQVHRAVQVDAGSGRRVCPGHAGPTATRVFEFWPSDFLNLFRRAGLPRNTPPPFAGDCTLTATAATGARPRILLPQATVTYAVDAARPDAEQLPLQAAADADARALFWFADGRFLGRSAPGETLLWKADPGRFVVRVVDDLGRADDVDVRVRLVAAGS